MTSYTLPSPHRTANLLKASPKGEGFHPSPSGTLREVPKIVVGQFMLARVGHFWRAPKDDVFFFVRRPRPGGTPLLLFA
jgi:hypothetical protein